MSEYQRFVTYINRYEGNTKINNAGFAKVESRGEQCKLEIHMKGIGTMGVEHPVYLLVREDCKLKGILLGKITAVKGNGDGSFIINGKDINQTGYDLKQVAGFLVPTTEQEMYASIWDDEGIQREKFEPLETEEKELLQATEAAPQLKVFPCVSAPRTGEKLTQQKDVIPFSKESVPSSEETAPSEKKTAPSPEEAIPSPEESWEEKWNFILDSYPVMTPFEENTEILCVRWELKDLRMLPKRYWYLGNNSFLLHGFFNYRYLIVGVMEQEGKKRWFLGVPGVFQSQEKVMAAIFGFPEFETEKIAKQKTGQFGYWYRYLNE